jgi:hypothetical protein
MENYGLDKSNMFLRLLLHKISSLTLSGTSVTSTSDFGITTVLVVLKVRNENVQRWGDGVMLIQHSMTICQFVQKFFFLLL